MSYDDTPVETAEPEAGVPRTPLGYATAIAALTTLAAAAAALWFGVGWVREVFFTEVPRAHAREDALDDARQAALNLTAMNPDDIDGSVGRMKSSLTGGMLDDFSANVDKIKQAAAASRTKIDSRVLGASLTRLTSERDHASALVVLVQNQVTPGQPAAPQRVTWTLDMVKTGAGWKAENATSLGAPVLLNAPGGQTPPAAPQPPAKPAPPVKPGN